MVDMQSTLKQRRTDQVTSDSNHVWKEAARLISIDGAHYDPIEGGSRTSFRTRYRRKWRNRRRRHNNNRYNRLR